MKSYDSDMTDQLVGRWWLSIIVGLVALCAGFVVLINPVSSYYAVAMWLGIAVLLSGVITLVQFFTTDNGLVRNGWVIVAAIADIIIGVLLMFNMLITVTIMPILFGIWLLCRGFVGILQGIDLRSLHLPNSGWVIFGSIIMLAVAMAVLLMPESLGIELVILFIAVAFLSYGFSSIALGLRLFDVHRRAKQMQ